MAEAAAMARASAEAALAKTSYIKKQSDIKQQQAALEADMEILEMEKDKLEMVQPNTIKVDKSGLRYEVGEKENGQQIGPIKVKSINKLYRQCEHKKCNNQVTWIKNIKQICPIRLQIQNEGQHTMDNLKDKMKVPKLTY